MSEKSIMEKLHALAPGKKLVLHMGCGTLNPEKLHPKFKGDDWFEVRCDINAHVKPHIIADMKDLSAVPDASFDAIWNSHSLEHLEAYEVPTALAEWFRVLKDEGEIIITLPDLRAVAAHIAHGRLEEPLYTAPDGPVSALDVVYGYGPDIAAGNKFMAHRTGFTAETLGKKLTDAGFSAVTVTAKDLNLWADAYKFPVGHPKKTALMRIVRDKNAPTPPPEPPLSKQRHPGALWPNKRTDELDVPPTTVKS